MAPKHQTTRSASCVGFLIRERGKVAAPGQTFNRLTILGHQFKLGTHWKAVVQCECSKVAVVNVCALATGHTRSCGCVGDESRRATGRARKVHADDTRSLLNVWRTMRARCTNPKNEKYATYGGRGIRILQEWLTYSAFRDWALSNGWVQGLTIERKDVDGNYEPGNCTFIPMSRQARNKTNTIYLTIDGVRKSLVEWCEQPGAVSRKTAYDRLRLGHEPRDAVFKSRRYAEGS